MYLRLRVRALALVVGLTALSAIGVDAGSVAVSRLMVPEEVRQVGQATADAIDGEPATQRSVTIALRVATSEAAKRGLHVKRSSFRLFQGGRVQLTGTKTARTLLIHRFEPLRHHTRVTASTSVTPLPFS